MPRASNRYTVVLRNLSINDVLSMSWCLQASRGGWPGTHRSSRRAAEAVRRQENIIWEQYEQDRKARREERRLLKGRALNAEGK